MDWNRLDKAQSSQILQHISVAADPGMFSPNSSEASFKPLSFYQDYMLYRVTNYASLPSFSLDFLSDGESFHLLDGSPSPINLVNAKGTLYLSESNVIDYVEFYLLNIQGEDGDIYLIREVENLPFLDSLRLDQQIELKSKHVIPSVAINEDTGDFIVLCDLFYDGTLVQAGVSVTQGGQIDIQPRDMIMASYRGASA